jgi:hypothetical protein
MLPEKLAKHRVDIDLFAYLLHREIIVALQQALVVLP